VSGPAIQAELEGAFPGCVVHRVLVPDERADILRALDRAVTQGADVVLTTGGTGLGPRDVTPEATRELCDREIPGIAEALRAEALRETPAGMLSRGYAGMRGTTIVVNFPGSPRGVRSCLRVLLPVLEHALAMAKGQGHG
jgi:molybdenum cofactor synthesis domain-containing protein